MRIVSRTELMALPAGTLYHDWLPCYFGALCIKGETLPAEPGYSGDWYEAVIPHLDVSSSDEDCDTQVAMDEKGLSHPLTFELEGREALYDDSLRYAVWERADVAALHAKLGKILNG